MSPFSPKLRLRKKEYKFEGRAQWNDPDPVFELHQLVFDTDESLVTQEKKHEALQAKSVDICARVHRLPFQLLRGHIVHGPD